MSVFQKTGRCRRAGAATSGVSTTSSLVGIQRWAARLTIALASDPRQARIEIRTRERLRLGDWYHVALTYDGSGKAAGLRLYVDGKLVRDARSFGTRWPDRSRTDAALGWAARPSVCPSSDRSTICASTTARSRPTRSSNSRFTISRASFSRASSASDRRKRPTEVREYFLTYAAPEALRTAYAELKALRAEQGGLEKGIPTAMVMGEMDKPRETFVLARGDYRNQTEKVQPGVPAMLPPLPKDAPLNRLTLAKWLVDPAHPLTARVAVNRFWQMYFGLGIVKTQEDFGVQGEPPVHPELLDWLATEFIRTGWDVRAMQRLIVTSATYRQSSKVTPALLEKDPENRLLARGPRVRLPAEMIRDTALAASGLLNDEIGGPSVLPYQPKGLWEEMAFGEGFSAQSYEQSHGKDLYRRGMYTLLEADGSAGLAGDVRRARSREVHGAPRADQHAAAGARAA